MSENGKQAFRNASIYGGEMTLRVASDGGVPVLGSSDVCCSSDCVAKVVLHWCSKILRAAGADLV